MSRMWESLYLCKPQESVILLPSEVIEVTEKNLECKQHWKLTMKIPTHQKEMCKHEKA